MARYVYAYVIKIWYHNLNVSDISLNHTRVNIIVALFQLDTNRLRPGVPVLQVSAHGKPTKLGIGGIGVSVLIMDFYYFYYLCYLIVANLPKTLNITYLVINRCLYLLVLLLSFATSMQMAATQLRQHVMSGKKEMAFKISVAAVH